MKIFVNVVRLEIGQLFTQGTRWGASVYFGHISSLCLQAVLICAGDWLRSEGHIVKLYGTILTKMHNINAYTEIWLRNNGVYMVNKTGVYTVIESPKVLESTQ